MHAHRADTYLVCRSDGRLCALALAHVVETMRPLSAAPLAGTPPFVLGVSIIRGIPVPIVDSARLLGSAQPPSPQRVVTLKVGERRVGLAVDAVIGVRAIASAALEEVPPLLRDVGAETVSAISTLDAQLLVVLQSARIVPESVWQALDAERQES